MNQQKDFARIALVVLVVIIAGVAGYLALIKKSPEVAQQTNTQTLTPTQNNTNNQDRITYSGQWNQAKFPQNDYHHSINLMLPSTWKFNCCGDTDSFSAHSIYPASSENNLETSPHITVYDFVLSGCPDGDYASCSIDQLQRVTPNQYMTSLTNHLDKNGEVAGLVSLKKTGTTRLSNFTSGTIVYSGMTRQNQPVDFYIIQSSKGVVGVAFQQPQNFDSSFKTEFLNRITTN